MFCSYFILDVQNDSVDVREGIGVIRVVVRIPEVFIKFPEREAIA
jgi:hypothetical protein